jgi:hypothetical protein
MTKPIWISSSIYEHLDSDLYQKLEVYHRADNLFWTGSDFIGHPRYGPNTVWNFSDHNIISSTPDLNTVSTKSFADINDQRAKELMDKINATGQRLAVFWSGGIDSTTVLAAIIKNFPAYLLQEVDVYLNNSSYRENPHFFHGMIKDKINHVNINDIDSIGLQQLFQEKLITDGEPADNLWPEEVGLSYLQRYGSEGLNEKMCQGRDRFVQFLSDRMCGEQAQQYWEIVQQNIHAVNAPVENVAQLIWWINFNYHWCGQLTGWYLKHHRKNTVAWAHYQKNYHPWFSTTDFQIWSFNPDFLQRLVIQNMSDYKMEAKKYIHALDRNDFYLRYKTKLGSFRRGASISSGLVIFDDGTCINDTRQVPEFVAEHCLIKS